MPNQGGALESLLVHDYWITERSHNLLVSFLIIEKESADFHQAEPEENSEGKLA